MDRGVNCQATVETQLRRFPQSLGVLALLVTISVLAGCSESEYNMADVEGTVTIDGQPVTWGTLMFTPNRSAENEGKPGKSSVGPVDDEGRFRLTTYRKHDGAIIGSHTIRFMYQPDAEADEAKSFFSKLGKKVPRSFRPKEPKVQVEAGENSIAIELISG
jgi:hypothetical protein